MKVKHRHTIELVRAGGREIYNSVDRTVRVVIV